MKRKLAVTAAMSMFALGAIAQGADAKLIIANTKIKNLQHSSNAGTTTVTGEIKTDAIPTRCAAGRIVYLIVNGVQKDSDFGHSPSPYTFTLQAPDEAGTWRVNIPKFKDEKTKICLGAHKEFTVP